MLGASDNFSRLPILTTVQNAKLQHFVQPGDCLEVKVSVVAQSADGVEIRALASVGDRQVARIGLHYGWEAADRNPEAARHAPNARLLPRADDRPGERGKNLRIGHATGGRTCLRGRWPWSPVGAAGSAGRSPCGGRGRPPRGRQLLFEPRSRREDTGRSPDPRREGRPAAGRYEGSGPDPDTARRRGGAIWPARHPGEQRRLRCFPALPMR